MILYTIIGALVGAGFASGQEIYLFFYKYGKSGMLGIFLCSFIFGITIYKTLKIIKQNQINNKYYLSNLTNVIINIFLCMTFFIMISGFGAYFYQEFRN